MVALVNWANDNVHHVVTVTWAIFAEGHVVTFFSLLRHIVILAAVWEAAAALEISTFLVADALLLLILTHSVSWSGNVFGRNFDTALALFFKKGGSITNISKQRTHCLFPELDHGSRHLRLLYIPRQNFNLLTNKLHGHIQAINRPLFLNLFNPGFNIFIGYSPLSIVRFNGV